MSDKPSLADMVKSVAKDAITESLRDFMATEDISFKLADPLIDELESLVAELNFDGDNVTAWVSGKDNAWTAVMPVKVGICTYARFGGPKGGQIEHVKAQIQCIEKLINSLSESKAELLSFAKTD